MSSVPKERCWPETGITDLNCRNSTNMPSHLANMLALFHSLLLLFLLMKSTTHPPSHLTQTYSPISSQKSFQQISGLLFFLLTQPGPTLSIPSPTALFSSKFFRQTISDILNTRKRTARDALFQALNYRHLLSRYNPVTPQDFDNKRQEIQAEKENFLSITTDSTFDLSWWRCAPISNLTFTPRDSSHLSSSSHTPHSQNENTSSPFSLSQENMAFLRHNAGLAVYQAFIGFNPASDSTPVKGTLLSFSRLDVLLASVTELLIEKESGGGRRQKEYTDAFAKFLPIATNQLIGSIRQFAQYWFSEEFQVDTESDSIEARKFFVFTVHRTATRILTLPSTLKSFLAIRADCFNTYVSKSLGNIHDCYIAELADDFRSLHCLGSNGP